MSDNTLIHTKVHMDKPGSGSKGPVNDYVEVGLEDRQVRQFLGTLIIFFSSFHLKCLRNCAENYFLQHAQLG